MIALSNKGKIKVLRSNLPRKSIKEVALKHDVSRTTVWRAINDYDTSNPILQDLIAIAHANALVKTEAEAKAIEIAELSKKAKPKGGE